MWQSENEKELLDLHDVIADSKKVVVYEYEMRASFILSWKPVEA